MVLKPKSGAILKVYCFIQLPTEVAIDGSIDLSTSKKLSQESDRPN